MESTLKCKPISLLYIKDLKDQSDHGFDGVFQKNATLNGVVFPFSLSGRHQEAE